ncbi:hypothetical protein ACO0QE_001202 [Hanseniaspora vineae]
MDTIIITFTSSALLYLFINHNNKFFHLHYYDPLISEYKIGMLDINIVLVSLLFQLLIRSIIIKLGPYILSHLLEHTNPSLPPFTEKKDRHNSISFKKKCNRFSEQLWLFVYYIFIITFGTVLYLQSEYYHDASQTFSATKYPQFFPNTAMKLYYLIQISCWFQQLITLHLEHKRKDYYEMLAHHLITIFLTVVSYCKNLWPMGHLIMLIMDVVDIFLIISKILNYLNLRKYCNVTFALFIVNWVVFRHGIYNYLTYITWKYIPLNLGDRFSSKLYKGIMVALVSLQGIQIIWLVMIIKLVVKLVTAPDPNKVNDSRSDDDDDEDDENDDDVGRE